MYISYVTESAPADLIVCNIQHKQKLCEKFQNLFYKTFKTCRKETHHGDENFKDSKPVEFSVHSVRGSTHIIAVFCYLPNTA